MKETDDIVLEIIDDIMDSIEINSKSEEELETFNLIKEYIEKDREEDN